MWKDSPALASISYSIQANRYNSQLTYLNRCPSCLLNSTFKCFWKSIFAKKWIKGEILLLRQKTTTIKIKI